MIFQTENVWKDMLEKRKKNKMEKKRNKFATDSFSKREKYQFIGLIDS